MNNKYTGSIGENIASDYLQKKGYRILIQNYTSRWGELDIIAEFRQKIIFIEVKTRKDTRRGMPYEAVTRSKLHHLRRTINYYILTNKFEHRKHQLDVIGILLKPDNSVEELKHYENVGW
ncbi:MAG: YraN family protein [bacterium]|nr:YraN family protein [bacterium]